MTRPVPAALAREHPLTAFEQRAWCEIRLRATGFGPALDAGRVVWAVCACGATCCRGWILRAVPLALAASPLETP